MKVPSRLWWPKWRLVAELKMSPLEVDRMTLIEVFKANDALDFALYVEHKTLKKKKAK